MTLSDIAAIYRIPLKELLENNPEIEDPNNVPIGTKIRVPHSVFTLVPAHYASKSNSLSFGPHGVVEDWDDGAFDPWDSPYDYDENGNPLYGDYDLDKDEFVERPRLKLGPYTTAGYPFGEVEVLPDGRIYIPTYMTTTPLDEMTENYKARDTMDRRISAAVASDAIKSYLKEKYPDLSKQEIKDICSGVEKHFMNGVNFSIQDSDAIQKYLDNNEIIKNYIYKGGEIAEISVRPGLYMPIDQTYDFRQGDILRTIGNAVAFGDLGAGGIGRQYGDGSEWIQFMRVRGYIPDDQQLNDTSIVSRVFEKGDLGGHYVTYTPGQPGYNERRDIVNTNLSTRTWPVVVIDNNTGKVGTEHR